MPSRSPRSSLPVTLRCPLLASVPSGQVPAQVSESLQGGALTQSHLPAASRTVPALPAEAAPGRWAGGAGRGFTGRCPGLTTAQVVLSGAAWTISYERLAPLSRHGAGAPGGGSEAASDPRAPGSLPHRLPEAPATPGTLRRHPRGPCGRLAPGARRRDPACSALPGRGSWNTRGTRARPQRPDRTAWGAAGVRGTWGLA